MGNESSVSGGSHFPDLDERLPSLTSSTSSLDDFQVLDLSRSGASDDGAEDIPWYKGVTTHPTKKSPAEPTLASTPPTPSVERGSSSCTEPSPLSTSHSASLYGSSSSVVSESEPVDPPAEPQPSLWSRLTWSRVEEPEPAPPPKTEREIVLERQLEVLQNQIDVLHVKWEQAMGRSQVVTQTLYAPAPLPTLSHQGAMPASMPNTSIEPLGTPVCTPLVVPANPIDVVPLVGASDVPLPPQATATIPSHDVPAPSEQAPVIAQAAPPAPPPPGPPPPPPPPLDAPLPTLSGRVEKKKKAPKTVTPEQISRQLMELIQASEVLPRNQAIAHKNFLDAFSMQNGHQILCRLVAEYHFLIKKFPLDPHRCFQIMLRWEKGLFSSLSKAEATKIRKDKWYEIATLESEDQIQQQITMIRQILEKRKKEALLRKKAEAVNAQRSNMIEELKHKQQARRDASQEEQAETELATLNKSQISLTDSEMFLSFCDD